MPCKDSTALRLDFGTFPKRPHAITCRPGCIGQIEHRRRVAFHGPPPHGRLHRRRRPRCMHPTFWNPGQFRDPPLDKRPCWVVLLSLLDRIVNAHRVDACHPGLHLKLAVVDAWLKVQKTPGQVLHPILPRVVHVVRQEADKHGTHPKIQVARFPNGPHAGVHQRNACRPLFPSFQPLWVVLDGQRIVRSVHVPPFEGMLRLKFLDEVAMPAQAAPKAWWFLPCFVASNAW